MSQPGALMRHPLAVAGALITATSAVVFLALLVAALIAKGQKVYEAQKCSVCHAIAGKGGKQNPLDGVGSKLSADETRLWITDPTAAAKKANSTKKPPMPNKYKLPPAELDALVAYMQSLKK